MENYTGAGPNIDIVYVEKAKFARFKEYIANDWPLPSLPYLLKISRGKARSYKVGGYCYPGLLNSDKGYALPPSLSGPALDAVQTKDVTSALESRMSSLMDYKTNKLLSKIKAQSLPLIMMYRERHETGKLVTSFLDSWLYCLKNIRHPKKVLFKLGVYDPQVHNYKFLRSLRKRTMSCKTAGEAWLQYRYAWTPLILDIQEGLKASSEFEKKGKTFTNRVGSKFEFKVTGYPLNPYNSKLQWGGRQAGERKGHFGCGVYYHITDSSLSALGSLMDVPTTVWDMVPYSFVVDWFVDISTYLDLRNATLGTSFTSGWASIYYTQTCYQTDKEINWSPSVLTWNLSASGSKTVYDNFHFLPRADVYFKRTVLTTFPPPKLDYPLKTSLIHGIDSFFLLAQIARRLKQKP